MKSKILDTLEESLQARINQQVMNISIMLENPMAIHDHTDFMGALELELDKIAELNDRLEALKLVYKEVY